MVELGKQNIERAGDFLPLQHDGFLSTFSGDRSGEIDIFSPDQSEMMPSLTCLPIFMKIVKKRRQGVLS